MTLSLISLMRCFLDHDPRSLKDEPDNNLKSMVKVFNPRIHEKIISPTYVRLPFKDRHYFSLIFVIKIFLPFLTYLVNSLPLLSSRSEDTIFDLEIPSGESKVHIEVLSVLWGNRLPIPDGSLPLSSRLKGGGNNKNNKSETDKSLLDNGRLAYRCDSFQKGRGSPGRNKTPGPWSVRIPMWQLFKGPGGKWIDKNEAQRYVSTRYEVSVLGGRASVRGTVAVRGSRTRQYESSVEELVPTPSESADLSDGESKCDVPVNDESSLTFATFSNPLFDSKDDFTSSDNESLSDEDVPKENFKIYSNPLFDEEIISTKIDPHCFNAESYLIESLLNRDTLIDSSPKFDYLLEEFSGELAHTDPIPPGVVDTDSEPEEEIRLAENLSYDNSSPRPPEERNSKIADTISLSPPPIPVEDSDSL
ncbi:hypothetical protein Tco_1113488 [Tanacetum coccineum]|uniref:Uncharacterized protein n=1 Tax=Tanacetum coccineum TaxID=301880 RepID=A0ABQ5ISE8_9ASTR